MRTGSAEEAQGVQRSASVGIFNCYVKHHKGSAVRDFPLDGLLTHFLLLGLDMAFTSLSCSHCTAHEARALLTAITVTVMSNVM